VYLLHLSIQDENLPVYQPQDTAQFKEYYDGVGYFDESHPEFVNAEGYGYHYEQMYEDDDGEEMIYEEMTGRKEIYINEITTY
jgi:hypothetical protein